ncbi:MAG: hypothetical protein H0V40_08505 [Actinobacteria bacterium]|nr:hypothetical protein [Actinomycetota bacterium]
MTALEWPDASLLIVFCSDRYDLPELLRGINEASGGVPLIGSTTGEIATGGPGDAGARRAVRRRGGRSARAARCRWRSLGYQLQDPRIVQLVSDALAGRGSRPRRSPSRSPRRC